MINNLNIIFAGTSEFSAQHLKCLIYSKHKVLLVLTKPDVLPTKRYKTQFNPVKTLALKHKINVLQPLSLLDLKIKNILKDINADIIVVASYGLIFHQELLNITRFGCINVHASLLPKWRGAAPIQRALCAGDNETGITIIKMNEKIDEGEILYKKTCIINHNDTCKSLSKKLSQLGSISLIKVLNKIINNKLMFEKQNDDFATYAKKINKKESFIDWSLPAIQIERNIRAFNPWPISRFYIDNYLIKVWSAIVVNSFTKLFKPGKIIEINKSGISISTGKGILKINILQLSGKKVMNVSEFINSNKKIFFLDKTINI